MGVCPPCQNWQWGFVQWGFVLVGFCPSGILSVPRTTDIAICEVGTISKYAITGRYFPSFLSEFEIFDIEQISIISPIHIPKPMTTSN